MNWIRVEDELPSIGEEVFIFPRPDDLGIKYTGELHGDGKWHYKSHENDGVYINEAKVTHWDRIPNDPD